MASNSTFLKFLTDLKENNIRFSLDTHLNSGRICIRGILFHSGDDFHKLKNLDTDSITKSFKPVKSKFWYLGDGKKAFRMNLEEEIILEIPEFENLNISNYPADTATS